MTVLPDFFVAGAGKSGTTTLCHWLAHHPEVCFSSPKEPNILARDDLDWNPYPFFERPSEWWAWDWAERSHELLELYEPCFAHRRPGQRLGEGTVSYYVSRRARQRIARHIPEARVIFLLRHPTERAYSEYWHLVRDRRATLPFADHLLWERSNALRNGRYFEHLTPWFELFPREQLLVLFTEELDARPGETFGQACRFLEVDEGHRPNMEVKNRTASPRSLSLQLTINRWAARHRSRLSRASGSATPLASTSRPSSSAGDATRRPRSLPARAAGAVAKKIEETLQEVGSRPPMDPELRARLDGYFERENRGLSELLGADCHAVWGLDV